jgi:hypothetical protein
MDLSPCCVLTISSHVAKDSRPELKVCHTTKHQEATEEDLG